MESLLAQIAELHARTSELKKMIVHLPSVECTKIRSCIYQLEAAIYVMERNAADAYSRIITKAGEAQA